jgi:curli biogenesis system outer membrane secretion channel CsgG
MNKKIFSICLVVMLVLASKSRVYSQQTIVIPEEVKKKCAEVELDDRVRLAVARFTKSTSGANTANIENFSSMLSNAMFEVNCFRMLSMVKENAEVTGATEASEVKPQLIITGEITEYNHKVKETNIVVSKKVTTTAHIGFILQIKDPVTKDILFSKSFNEDGSNDNKSLNITMPANRFTGTTRSNVSTSSTNDNVDKAYFDALEKGIIQAVEFVVSCRDKIYNIAKSTGNKATITAMNTNFPKLMEIEKALRELGEVKKIEKSLSNDIGKVEVYFSGKIDEVINLLSTKMSNTLEITGLKENNITVKFK